MSLSQKVLTASSQPMSLTPWNAPLVARHASIARSCCPSSCALCSLHGMGHAMRPVYAEADLKRADMGAIDNAMSALCFEACDTSFLGQHFLTPKLPDLLLAMCMYIQSVCTGGPFKIGITENPLRRFHCPRIGYADEYRKMVILYASTESKGWIMGSAGCLENYLIRWCQENFRHLCMNRAGGGGGASSGAGPHYVYVVTSSGSLSILP